MCPLLLFFLRLFRSEGHDLLTSSLPLCPIGDANSAWNARNQRPVFAFWAADFGERANQRWPSSELPKFLIRHEPI
jgi:hypothetical protein